MFALFRTRSRHDRTFIFRRDALDENQILDPLLVQKVLGQHFANRLAQNRARILRQFLLERQLFQMADIARVLIINFVGSPSRPSRGCHRHS